RGGRRPRNRRNVRPCPRCPAGTCRSCREPEVGADRGVVAGLLALALVAVDARVGAGLRELLRRVDDVDAQAVALGEGELAVVPPAIDAALGVLVVVGVDEAEALDVLEALARFGHAVRGVRPSLWECNVAVEG